MGTLIISACDKVNREIARINDVLIGLLQFELVNIRDKKGPEIKALVLNMINTVSAENYELSAAGFFKLNYNTLFYIVGCVPAYLLIIPKEV